MFTHHRHTSRMRIFRDRMNSDFETLHPNNFPQTFAVCRGITQHPVFQILRIERVRGYDEYATYVFRNSSFQNTEYNIIHEGNPEDACIGQMEVYRPPPNPNQRNVRVRFQIRNVFLVSQHEVIPVVMIDTLEALPEANILVVPRNAIPVPEYFHSQTDPNFINNFLMDRNNYRIVDNRHTYRAFNRYFMMREQGRGDNWFEYNHDYEDDDYPRAERQAHREYYDMPPPIYGGAGAGALGPRSTRTRRDSRRPSTPPLPAPAAATPAASPRPPPVPAPRPAVALQAFTIQALISHAISENMTCPISMNAIKQSTACVTSCQHIFERDSITHWLADHSNCPVCRQPTSICN